MDSHNVYQAPESDLSTIDGKDHEFAGFWIRVLASLIDTLLLMAVTVPILIAVYGKEYWSGSMSSGVLDLMLSYVFPAVAVILFWVYKSATPGKMIFKLKVISLGDSEQLSVGQATGRYFAYFLATLPLCLGLIWVAFDKRKQGWHDKLAGTAVVKRVA